MRWTIRTGAAPLLALCALAAVAAGCGRVEPDTPAARQARISARLQAALATEDLPAALRAREELIEGFEGRMRTDRGLLPAAAVTAAVLDTALAVARERIAGDAPDPAAAARALEAADELAGDLEVEDLLRLEGVRTWVLAARSDDLPGAEGVGPRVVVWAADFDLGEVVLASVLARWAREGAAGGLDVVVVPVLRGEVRVGIRRHAADRAAELRSIADRLEGTGVRIADEPMLGEAAFEILGIGPQEAAVAVIARGGRVLGRVAGPMPDPRRLEGAVQRAAGR